MPTRYRPSSAVRRCLRKLGADIKEARLVRRLPMQIVAERAATTRQTLIRVENGDSGVSMAIYAGVLQAMSLLENLSNLVDPKNDPVGQVLAAAALPKRARSPKPPKDDG